MFNSLQEYRKKLEKVNAIIKQIAEKNEYITPILSSDYTLFEEYFNQEKQHTYGNSWLYVTQGTCGIGPENLGYKYYDGENLCALAIYPKIEQPDIIMLHWIRPLGENILPIIVNLANQIKREYGICSYVKKLFPVQYEFLLQHGFRSAKEFPWHSSAHSEDDTYPELIYDRESTLQHINNPTNATQLGRTFKIINKFKQNNAIKITSANFTENAWNIVNKYFAMIETHSNKPNVSTPFDYYNMIFFKSRYDYNIDKKILYLNNEFVGFYVLMRDLKFDVSNIYSYITLRNHYNYLTDLLKLFIFQTEKTTYINSGGSEDLGICNFKRKYLPIKQNTMFWTTNYLSRR